MMFSAWTVTQLSTHYPDTEHFQLKSTKHISSKPAYKLINKHKSKLNKTDQTGVHLK